MDRNRMFGLRLFLKTRMLGHEAFSVCVLDYVFNPVKFDSMHDIETVYTNGIAYTNYTGW